eukprot:GEMP01094411.1.p1 GENE.GEMP01094411.1~~GEMP01094411.1.p1  ORF type:complete len:169 (+),score=37.91 GEMP01094411.1:306-812(+)
MINAENDIIMAIGVRRFHSEPKVQRVQQTDLDLVVKDVEYKSDTNVYFNRFIEGQEVRVVSTAPGVAFHEGGQRRVIGDVPDWKTYLEMSMVQPFGYKCETRASHEVPFMDSTDARDYGPSHTLDAEGWAAKHKSRTQHEGFRPDLRSQFEIDLFSNEDFANLLLDAD